MATSQVRDFIENPSLQACTEFMRMSTPSDLPAGSVPSFLVNQVMVGDVMVMPMGYMFVEKAVNSNSICIKVARMIHDES